MKTYHVHRNSSFLFVLRFFSSIYSQQQLERENKKYFNNSFVHHDDGH